MLGAAKTKEIANLQNVCIFLNDCKTKHQIYNLKKKCKTNSGFTKYKQRSENLQNAKIQLIYHIKNK
jgi:hypothetical protein